VKRKMPAAWEPLAVRRLIGREEIAFGMIVMR
jgi:hypothetical protein